MSSTNQNIEQDDIEYQECIGCEGDFEPIPRDENDYNSHKFCSLACEQEYRKRSTNLAREYHAKQPALRQKASKIVSSQSTIAAFNDMLELCVCPVCAIWGGVSPKSNRRVICGAHIPRKPRKFLCATCKVTIPYDVLEAFGKVDNPIHCGVTMMPLFARLPEHLKGFESEYVGAIDGYVYTNGRYVRPKANKWTYAQVHQRVGTVSGLDALARLADELGMTEDRLLTATQELSVAMGGFNR